MPNIIKKKKTLPSGTVHTIKKKPVLFVDTGPRLEVTIQGENGQLYKVNTGGPGPIRPEEILPEVSSEDIMWQEAERFARMPGEREDKLFTAAMELRIEHCKRSIKETGEVVRPFELIDLYWPRPGIHTFDAKTARRYGEITERIYRYLSQLFANAEEDNNLADGWPTFDRGLKSYRVTMGAIELDHRENPFQNYHR
jgi:hypothetical protein